jgi:hypothetical protein
MDNAQTARGTNGEEPARYDGDIVAWATEQARLIREGQFDKLDIAHVADEIEDVGKTEQQEIANRLALLVAHLLKWHCQPSHRNRSWELTIHEQRRRSARRIKKTPSLRPLMRDEDWIGDIWSDALLMVMKETGLIDLPKVCLWDLTDEVMVEDWLPE